MLTSFCDDLTLRADELDECHMIPHADAMREAAEIIRYLREFGIENEVNRKLRDLMHDVWAYYVSGTLHPCELCDRMLDCENHPALSCKHGCTTDFVEDVFMDRMRELGVEVE